MAIRFAAAKARPESPATEREKSVRPPEPAKAAPPVRSHLEALRHGAVLAARQQLSLLGADAPPGHRDNIDHSPTGYCWSAARIALAQEVWGEGFVAPGGTDLIMSLVEPLGLKRNMTVLELGAGLGGAARIMAERPGARVTGVEWDPRLAEAGMALSIQARMVRKAPVLSLDETVGRMTLMSFDRFFAKDCLFALPEKSRFLRLIGAVLRHHGELLFTDLVLAASEWRTPAVEAWIATEPETPDPWSAADYVKLLSKLGLHTRVEDITERIWTAIHQNWADFDARIERTGLDPTLSAALASEALLWTRRVGLLESGELNVCRFHVARRL